HAAARWCGDVLVGRGLTRAARLDGEGVRDDERGGVAGAIAGTGGAVLAVHGTGRGQREVVRGPGETALAPPCSPLSGSRVTCSAPAGSTPGPGRPSGSSRRRRIRPCPAPPGRRWYAPPCGSAATAPPSRSRSGSLSRPPGTGR